MPKLTIHEASCTHAGKDYILSEPEKAKLHSPSPNAVDETMKHIATHYFKLKKADLADFEFSVSKREITITAGGQTHTLTKDASGAWDGDVEDHDGLTTAVLSVLIHIPAARAKQPTPAKAASPKKPSPKPNLKELIEKNELEYMKMRLFAIGDQWANFHPDHVEGHYDWWAFPVTRPSKTYGTKYAVTLAQVETLKKNATFMNQYRAIVKFVVKSWGWDLDRNAPIDDPKKDQEWRGYGVRLGKMASSLKLFGEHDLYQRLCAFVEAQVDLSQLEPWVQAEFPKS